MEVVSLIITETVEVVDASVNALMADVDPFADDAFDCDISEWQATIENECYHDPTEYGSSIYMMNTRVSKEPIDKFKQALMVLSDSGANIVGIPEVLPKLLQLEEFVFDPPYLVEFGNQQSE